MRICVQPSDVCRSGTPWPPHSPRSRHVTRLSEIARKRGGYGVPPLQLLPWVFVLLVGLAALQACSRGGESTRGIVIVSAPEAGVIRRILAREGMEVADGQAIAEIAIYAAAQSAPTTGSDQKQASAAMNLQSAQAEIEAARSEVVRHEVEVQRLTPLVAAGQASQGELDGERALYERAQQRLQKAKTAAQQAQSGLVSARQQSLNSPIAAPSPAEQIVVIRASAAGTLSAVNARIGERVTAGQPLATIRVR
jgi:multidrug resistance efflux pump